MVIVSALCWCAYAFFEGLNEAINFHNAKKDIRLIEVHGYYTMERFFVGIVFGFTMIDFSKWITILNILTLPLFYVMIHDGVYYFKRNKLDGSYPLGFWDITKTSTSKLDQLKLTTPLLRVVYFIIGILALILINK